MGAALGPEAAGAPHRVQMVDDEDLRASETLVVDASGSAVDDLLSSLDAALSACRR